MKFNNPTRRYKIEFIVDTHLSHEKILEFIGVFEGYMIKITEEQR